MPDIKNIDPREITAFFDRFVAALPDLVLAFVAACEADPAFLALCREQGVEGGVSAGIAAVREAAEVAR